MSSVYILSTLTICLYSQIDASLFYNYNADIYILKIGKSLPYIDLGLYIFNRGETDIYKISIQRHYKSNEEHYKPSSLLNQNYIGNISKCPLKKDLLDSYSPDKIVEKFSSVSPPPYELYTYLVRVKGRTGYENYIINGKSSTSNYKYFIELIKEIDYNSDCTRLPDEDFPVYFSIYYISNLLNIPDFWEYKQEMTNIVKDIYGIGEELEDFKYDYIFINYVQGMVAYPKKFVVAWINMKDREVLIKELREPMGYLCYLREKDMGLIKDIIDVAISDKSIKDDCIRSALNYKRRMCPSEEMYLTDSEFNIFLHIGTIDNKKYAGVFSLVHIPAIIDMVSFCKPVKYNYNDPVIEKIKNNEVFKSLKNR